MPRFSLLLTLLIITCHGQARPVAKPAAIIPFHLVKEKYVLVETVVNDQDTLMFYFDTGATASVIDQAAAETLGITADYEREIDGAGGKTSIKVATNEKLALDGVELANQHLVIQDLQSLEKMLEYPLQGIIGRTLMSQYYTELDYEQQQIKLYDLADSLDVSAYSAHPFRFDRGIPIPQLDVSIELTNGNTYSGPVFFDSGAGLTLLVNTPFSEENQLAEQAEKVLSKDSQGFSGKSVAQQMAVKSLTLGKYSFTDLPISLASGKGGVSAYEGYLGILGAEVINRFNVLLDYESKTMYLKPNASFSKPFSFPLSGLSLRENDEGEIYIHSVSEQSPAYAKGIRAGSVVLAVNGYSGNDLATFRKQLKEKGTEVNLELITHDNTRKTYRFRLERLL